MNVNPDPASIPIHSRQFSPSFDYINRIISPPHLESMDSKARRLESKTKKKKARVRGITCKRSTLMSRNINKDRVRKSYRAIPFYCFLTETSITRGHRRRVLLSLTLFRHCIFLPRIDSRIRFFWFV